MIQRKYLYPVALVVVLIAIWTAGWFWLARVIESGLEDYAARQAGNPAQVSWDGVAVSGYPNRLFTHITKPRGTWAGPDGEIAWAGPATTLKFFTDFGRTVAFRSPGAHQFLVAGPLAGDSVRALAATGDRVAGQMGFDGSGRVTSLRGEATKLDLQLDGQPLTTLDTAAFDWTLADGDANALHPDPAGQSLTFALSGASLVTNRLDPDLVDTLGRKLDRLAGEVAIRGALDAENLSSDEIARWRDAGGTLDLNDFVLMWGPLRIAGSGTLAADGALQPVGALSARISGLDRLLDLLERAGQIRPQQAAIARIALAVLTRAPADGGPAEARVPVTIQDRQLSIGPIPLLRLPAIAWD